MEAVDVHRLQFGFAAGFHYLFPQLTMGLALLIFILKTLGLRGDEASNLTLIAALATAAGGVFPNTLTGRDPAHSLTIQDAAARSDSLVMALWWWIPGMLLVAGYFAFIYSRMPRPVSILTED